MSEGKKLGEKEWKERERERERWRKSENERRREREEKEGRSHGKNQTRPLSRSLSLSLFHGIFSLRYRSGKEREKYMIDCHKTRRIFLHLRWERETREREIVIGRKESERNAIEMMSWWGSFAAERKKAVYRNTVIFTIFSFSFFQSWSAAKMQESMTTTVRDHRIFSSFSS